MKWSFLLILFITNSGWAQNLVPNPSFEEYNACPDNGDQIWLAEPWTNVLGGIDYYHECGTIDWSIPVNKGGGGYANSGQAYIGFGIWAISSLGSNAREFVGVELIDALIPGKRYNVEFYISMQDSVWYATKSMGTYLSNIQPPWDLDTLLSKEPQVKYEGTEFLTEKEGWTKIEGSFIAEGGEKYITIGNFDDDANTETVFVPGGGVFKPDLPHYWEVVGYFIDDVSVTVDTTIGINELEEVKFDVYPNPSKGAIIVETEQIYATTTFQLVDITGRIIFSVSLSSTKTAINLSALSPGIYAALLFQNDAVISRKKIVKE